MRPELLALVLVAGCAPRAASVPSNGAARPSRPSELAGEDMIAGGLPLVVPPPAEAPGMEAPHSRTHRDPLCVRAGPSPAAPPARLSCCYVPQSAMRERVMARAPGFSACWDAALARDPALEGTIVGRFTVDPDGVVRSACEVRDEASVDGIDDPALVACVLRELTRVVFPPLDGCSRIRVTYPLRFQPR